MPVSKEITQRYEQLKKIVGEYRRAFHVEDKEIVSSEALDSLKEELVQIEKKYPELITSDSPTQRVAGTALGVPLDPHLNCQTVVDQMSFESSINPIQLKEAGVGESLSVRVVACRLSDISDSGPQAP